MNEQHKAKILELLKEVLENIESLGNTGVAGIMADCKYCGSSDIRIDDENIISYEIDDYDAIVKSMKELAFYIENEDNNEVKASKEQLPIFQP